MDFGAGPSRPQPIPYDDDPYSDSYGLPEAVSTTTRQTPTVQSSSPPLSTTAARGSFEQTRGRGRGMRERGRGRGQDRRRGERGRGRGRGRGGQGQYGHARQASSAPDDRRPPTGRSLSPTSVAIARATGQFGDTPSYQEQSYQQPGDNTWGYQYPNQYPSDFGYQQPYVQPHINPRFASMFGIDVMHGYPPQMQNAYDPTSTYGGGQWSNQWQTNARGDDAPRGQY